MLVVNCPTEPLEEGEFSDVPDQTVTDQEQPVSEEQNYRETMQGIRSFMG